MRTQSLSVVICCAIVGAIVSGTGFYFTQTPQDRRYAAGAGVIAAFLCYQALMHELVTWSLLRSLLRYVAVGAVAGATVTVGLLIGAYVVQAMFPGADQMVHRDWATILQFYFGAAIAGAIIGSLCSLYRFYSRPRNCPKCGKSMGRAISQHVPMSSTPRARKKSGRLSDDRLITEWRDSKGIRQRGMRHFYLCRGCDMEFLHQDLRGSKNVSAKQDKSE